MCAATIAGGFRAVRVKPRTQPRGHQERPARADSRPCGGPLFGSAKRGDILAVVEVKRRLHPPPDTTPRFLPRLLSISAERATAKSLVIVAPNGKRVEFSAVNGAGIVGHKTIRIFEGDVIYGVLHARHRRAARAISPSSAVNPPHDHRGSRVAGQRQFDGDSTGCW
jgi:hypothetical protein